VDWNPDRSTSFLAKIDRMINRAYQHLSLEAPFLFFEDECRILTQQDKSNGTSSTDRLRPCTTAEVGENDKLVLYREYSGSTSPPPLPDGWTEWKFDHTWDGRLIELERTSGEVLRRRAREFWTTTIQVDNNQGGVKYVTREFVSLDHEWPLLTETGLKYRIFTPEYELPADVVELRSARFWNDVRDDISVVNQYDMERYEYTDFRGEEVGRPTMLFRGRHHQIDAPFKKPATKLMRGSDVAGHPVGMWTGPDNIGSFQYCYTYVWGKREKELKAPSAAGTGDAGTFGFEPKWESAPSPVSNIVHMNPTNSFGSSTSQVIKIDFPNIDDRLLFGQKMDAGTSVDRIRTGHSGYNIRIYVRRLDLQMTPNTTGNAEVTDGQKDSPFYFLDEINGDSIVYLHKGQKIPDYYRRLKETHGYQTIRFHPMPDNFYEIDCRVLRRPQKLVVDTDAPRLHEEACEVLIQMACAYLYEMQGQMDAAAVAGEKATQFIKLLVKRYGAIPAMRPQKRMARVRSPYREVRVKFTEN
jgi:hypothetical protein